MIWRTASRSPSKVWLVKTLGDNAHVPDCIKVIGCDREVICDG
ncbi:MULTISPECIES: hypothetical protein [unclassified Microcoleus]|nr:MULTISPECIES: hypothetical protein [unclassified Microcoleus]